MIETGLIETGISVEIDAAPAKAGATEVKQAFESVALSAETSLGRVRTAATGLGGSFMTLKVALLGLGIGTVLRELFDFDRQVQSIKFTLYGATGSMESAAYEFLHVREVANKLGVDLGVAADQFSKMAAAAKGGVFQGDAVRKVFDGFATAIAGMHINAEKTGLIFLALQQMVGKGAIQMSELRRQLAQSLPGSMKAFSDALGVSQEKLAHMARTGDLAGKTLLKAMTGAAESMRVQWESAALQAVHSTQGLFNIFKNTMRDIGAVIIAGDLGKAFNDSLRRVIQAMRSTEFLDAAIKLGTILAKGLDLAIRGFEFLVKHANEVGLAIGFLIGLNLVGWAASSLRNIIYLVEAFKDLKNAVLDFELVQSGLSLFGGKTNALVREAAVAGPPTLDALRAEKEAMAADAVVSASLAADAVKDLGVPAKTPRGLMYPARSAVVRAEQNARLPEQGNLFQGFATEETFSKEAAAAGKNLDLFAVEVRNVEKEQLAMAAASTVASGGLKRLVTDALGAAKAFIRMDVKTMKAELGRLAVAARGAAASMLSFAVANPLTALLIAIAAVILALYLLRDTTFQIGKETFKVSDIWYGVKAAVRHVVQSIKDDWNMLFVQLKEDWKKTLGLESFGWVGTVFGKIADTIIAAFARVKNYLAGLLPDWAVRLLREGKGERLANERLASAHDKPAETAEQRFLAAWKSIYGVTDTKPTPNGPQKFGNEDLKKNPFEAGQKAVDKLREELLYTQQLTVAYDDNAGEQSKLILITAKLKAEKEAEEKITQLGAKATEYQKQAIRELTLELEISKVRMEEFKNISEKTFEAKRTQQQGDARIAALKKGEAAMNEENIQEAISNELVMHSATLNKEQIKILSQKVEVIERMKLKEKYEQEAVALKEQLNPLYALSRETEHLNLLNQTGVLTVAEYTRAYADMERKAEEAINRILEKSKKWQDGVVLGMREIQMKTQDTARLAADAFVAAFDKMHDMLLNFLDTGKFKFKDFIKEIQHQMNNFVLKDLENRMMNVLIGKNGEPGILEKILGPDNPLTKALKGARKPTGGIGDPLHVVIDGGATSLSKIGSDIVPSSFPIPGVTTGVFGAPTPLDPLSEVTDIFRQQATTVGGDWRQQGAQTGEAWKSQATGFGNRMQQVIATMTSMLSSHSGGGGGGILGAITGVLGHLLPGIGGAISGIGQIPISEIPSPMSGIPIAPLPPPTGFAKGGVMTSFGEVPLRMYSSGGIASSPQMAMFGEGASPEAYVPLPDGRSIPVTVGGGHSQTVVIHNNLHVHGVQNVDGFRRSSDQIMNKLQKATARAVNRNG